MSQILIRNLEEETVAGLKYRAKSNHRSLQAEVQLILEKASKIQATDFWDNAKKIRDNLQESGKTFSDSTELLRKERDA